MADLFSLIGVVPFEQRKIGTGEVTKYTKVNSTYNKPQNTAYE